MSDHYELYLYAKTRYHLTGGCGPGCMDKLLPQGPLNVACQYHDFAYTVGGTKSDFEDVEARFRTLLLSHARARGSIAWLLVAYVYSAWTSIWGYRLRRWTRRDAPELRLTELGYDAINPYT